MAVELSLTQLAEAIRADESDPTLARLLQVAEFMIERLAPVAPSDVQDQATIQFVGYLFDRPFTSRGKGFSNALVNSGAAALLLPWRVHRAGSTADQESEDIAIPDLGDARFTPQEIERLKELANSDDFMELE